MKAYQQIEIRSRRLIDVEKLDTSTELFGAKWETPIFLCPGLDTSRINTRYDSSLTWDFVKRLKDATQMKLVLKGIVMREDAEIAPRTWREWDRRIEPRWARRGDASPHH